MFICSSRHLNALLHHFVGEVYSGKSSRGFDLSSFVVSVSEKTLVPGSQIESSEQLLPTGVDSEGPQASIWKCQTACMCKSGRIINIYTYFPFFVVIFLSEVSQCRKLNYDRNPGQ